MSQFSVLEELKRNNQYPMVFIGSGISKRYLVDFPGWEDLLEFFWKQLHQGKDFYAYLNNLRNVIKDRKPDLRETEIIYLTNIEAGTEIECIFNEKYYREEIEVDNFSQKQAYRLNISPFKKALSNRFGNYSIKPEMNDELNFFKKFLNKTQIILTTNYDLFIEDCYNSINESGVKKYIGQNGFFEQTEGWAELFKLHGSVEEPGSIIISKEDYAKFENNSILISARIISLLINSPIIFLGYSLTDMNIRKILKDFSSSLNANDIKKMGSRIIIVERDEGRQDIVENKIYDNDLNCEYTVLKTDNFLKLFKEITEINQGVSPSEVRKYQHIIKQLIVDSGKKGSLNSLLVAPEQLDEIEKRIGDEKLVVALGDTTYIFRMPDLMTYIYDYIFEENSIHTDIALRYVATQNINSRIPFIKYTQSVDLEKTQLNHVEKEKIKQRINNQSSLKVAISSINISHKIKINSLSEIKEQKFKRDKELDIVSFNVRKISIDELEIYVKGKVEELKEKEATTMSTSMRRLLLIYDIIKYKRDNA